MKNQSFKNKLENALTGLLYAWDHEDNIRTQVALAGLTVLIFLFVQPALIWWGLIFLCIGMVIAAEIANSAMEALIDHIHPKIHPSIRHVKDMLAGMVLVLSGTTVLIALLAIIDSF